MVYLKEISEEMIANIRNMSDEDFEKEIARAKEFFNTPIEDKIQELKQCLLDERNTQLVMVCTMEEMAELTKVLSKFIRGSRKFSREKLVEEMAHVLLQVDLLKQEFSISDEEIQMEQIDALERCFKEK